MTYVIFHIDTMIVRFDAICVTFSPKLLSIGV